MKRNLEAEFDALKAVIFDLAQKGGYKQEYIDQLFHSELKSRTTPSPTMCDYCDGGDDDHCTCQEMTVPHSKKTWGCQTCGGTHSSDFTACPHYSTVDGQDNESWACGKCGGTHTTEPWCPTYDNEGSQDQNDYGYMPADMESPGILAQKICNHATHAEDSIAQRDQMWRDFVTVVQNDNPSADALDKIWQEIIIKHRPDYGDWEYPGMAFRHIVCEFEELRKERDTLVHRVGTLERVYISADNVIAGIRRNLDDETIQGRIQQYDKSRGLDGGTIPAPTKKNKKPSGKPRRLLPNEVQHEEVFSQAIEKKGGYTTVGIVHKRDLQWFDYFDRLEKNGEIR